jgi:hypothetical protein
MGAESLGFEGVVKGRQASFMFMSFLKVTFKKDINMVSSENGALSR